MNWRGGFKKRVKYYLKETKNEKQEEWEVEKEGETMRGVSGEEKDTHLERVLEYVDKYLKTRMN
jgi:hypothetical protein